MVYTVIGLLKKEWFEVQRRYSDFAALRASLVDRFPGLYVPNVPSKKAIGNTKQAFVEERCFLLNMFIKQLCRCPYLIDSQEFAIFVKPQTASLQRELSLLPSDSPEALLNSIRAYFSFMGEITQPIIDAQNKQILQFAEKARKLLDFMHRFLKHLQEMEVDYGESVESTYQMNCLLNKYEKTLY